MEMGKRLPSTIKPKEKDMTDYSIIMNGVNANLFDTNQAKTRILKPLETSKTPGQEDISTTLHFAVDSMENSS